MDIDRLASKLEAYQKVKEADKKGFVTSKVASKEFRPVKKALKSAFTHKAWWLNIHQEEEPVTRHNVLTKSLQFAEGFLDKFEVSGKVDLHYTAMRNASYNGENNTIVDADISLDFQVKTISGVKCKAELLIPIRDGMFLEPSTIRYNGRDRIIAQSTFDDMIRSNTVKRPMDYQDLVMDADVFKNFRENQLTYVCNQNDVWNE